MQSRWRRRVGPEFRRSIERAACGVVHDLRARSVSALGSRKGDSLVAAQVEEGTIFIAVVGVLRSARKESALMVMVRVRRSIFRRCICLEGRRVGRRISALVVVRLVTT